MENIFSRRNIIIVAIIIVVLIITAIFFFGLKTTPEQPGQGFFPGIFPGGGGNVEPQPTTQQPSATTTQNYNQILQAGGPRALPQWSLVQLGSDPIASLVAFGTTTRYHKNTSDNLGRLFEREKATLDKEARITNMLIQQMAQVSWSPLGNKAAITYKDENQNLNRFFIEYKGTTTPKTHFMDSAMTSPVFSPNGNSLAYITETGDSNNVYISDTNFKKTTKIYDNNIPDFELSWPSQNILALKSKSSYASEGFLYTLKTGGGLLKKIAQGFGLDAVWGNDAKNILFSTSNASSGKPQSIKWFDVASSKTQELPIITIAEKCIFGKENPNIIYCGAPQSIPAGLYPDAWWQGKVSLQDDIVVIDVSAMRQIAKIQTQSDIINPVIFSDDSYLFFRDKNTNLMWALKLKDDTVGNLPQ